MSQIAFFQHMSAAGENVPVQRLLDGIKSGAWKGQVNRLRQLQEGTPQREAAKRSLPAHMLSGSTRGGHKAADVLRHSGLLQIDIDHVPDPSNVRDRIGEDRHILAAWISPSGDGVKAAMRVPADIERHKEAFDAAADYMRETYALEIDGRCSDVGRLCFVSFDPDLVTNHDAVELQVSGEVFGGSGEDNSSTSLNLHPTTYILPLHLHLHNNGLFDDFPNARPLYQKLVSHRYGKPQKGTRNQAMVEIVAECFCAVAPEFVIGFVVEYYNQHVEVFTGYDFERFKHEAETMLAGCHRSYSQRLSEDERNAFASLRCDKEQAAFRIAQSLSKCESDATVPPPLFHLSAVQLATRLGIMDMQAWRILQAFEKSGFIQVERAGTRRTKGVQGIATVYRWCLAET